MQTLRIATRNSRLALWQAKQVALRLSQCHPSIVIELVGMTTEGDILIDEQLYKLGGKGLFLKELQTALLDDRADLAVHSAKDIPAMLPTGSYLVAVLERDDARDALVSNHYQSLEQLPDGAIIGTSSLRRASLLRYNYPHLKVRSIRGNIDTRLAKLDRGEYQALILATAGLTRLGMGERICQRISIATMLPALGQGVIAIEVRDDKPEIAQLLAAINHSDSWDLLECERAFGAKLGADCHLPIAAHATLVDSSALHPTPKHRLRLQALVAAVDGSTIIDGELTGDKPRQLGNAVAEQLLERGAAELLGAV